MPKFEVITDSAEARTARDTLKHFCETRPGVVKKMGFQPRGDSAVTQTEWGTVEWMFDNRHDRDKFHEIHSEAVVIKGGPKND